MAQIQWQQDVPLSVALTHDPTHSRIVRRQCLVFTANAKMQTIWAGLKTFVVAERVGVRDGQPWSEFQFYLSRQILTAQQLLADTVGLWGIDFRWHWVKDVTFSEDLPLRLGANAPVNWATWHTFFITIARFLGFRTIP
jgi:hypothetical protein